MLKFQSVWGLLRPKAADPRETLNFKEFFKKGEMRIAHV